MAEKIEKAEEIEKTDVEKIFGGAGIEKSYGRKKVLNGVDFALPRGKTVGLFGLNGAGKSTLMKILSGLELQFKGMLYDNDFSNVAYMAVDNIFPSEMRVKDAVNFYAEFTDGVREAEIYAALAARGIKKNKLLSLLSTGMRQYVKFLLAIYSGAEVCLFDEPFSNLDVNVRTDVAQKIIAECSEERLFVITTHEIKEAENLIDGFLILKDGVLSKYYSAEEVREETGKSVAEFYGEYVNGRTIYENDTK